MLNLPAMLLLLASPNTAAGAAAATTVIEGAAETFKGAVLTASSLIGPPKELGGAVHASGKCDVRWFEQSVDHFGFQTKRGSDPLWPEKETYLQRYFFCDGAWRGPGAPIFFYLGNEDNVELYVNNTGLMWETAPSSGALLIFAEHRYYGESLPYPDGTPGCMNPLSTDQALADFAVLIDFLRTSLGAEDSAVVGFGGSYGGMMATWFRLKYPHMVDGVIAASAPIWTFQNMAPPYDDAGFMRIVTDDASPKRGSPENCAANFRLAQPLVARLARTIKGRGLLAEAFRTCHPLNSTAEAMGLIGWMQGPWSTLAMGNFPYPSSYLIHGREPPLPAWPVKVMVEPMRI